VALGRAIGVLLITCTVNAFWGLPFAHATLTHANEIANSKNNQMATDDIYLKNQKYGNFTDTAFMRSFSLDYVQYDHTTGTQENMFTVWKNHIDKPSVQIIFGVFFVLAILGAGVVIRRRWKTGYPFIVLFIFSFLIVGNDIPYLSVFSQTLQTIIPLFHNVFRFVFTKFFTLYAFAYSILVAISMYEILHVFSKKPVRNSVMLGSVFAGILFWYALPSFQGNFIYKNLRVTIPKEYSDMFHFFDKQNPSDRIVVLPAPWYWAWTQYRWDVIGSGFEWFGISQPIIDRAFDPWSRTNENLYWELSQAIFTKNPTRFETILHKYNVSWVILDENIINAGYERALYTDSIKQTLAALQGVTVSQKYGKISLYHNPLKREIKSFVSLYQSLPNIGPMYTWNDYDAAYQNASSYFTDPSQAYDAYFPFRSLFAGHAQKELEFTVTDNPKDYAIQTKIPLTSVGKTLILPALNPATFTDSNSKTGVPIVPVPPWITIYGSLIASPGAKLKKQNLLTAPDAPITVHIHKITTFLTYDSNGTSDLKQQPKSCDGYNTGIFSRTQKEENGSAFVRLTSIKSSNCLTIDLSHLYQKTGYLIKITQRYVEGKPLSVSVTNNDTRRTFLDTTLGNASQDSGFTPAYLIIPPMDPYGIGYTLTLDNISIGNKQTTNDIERIEVYQLPYEFLTNIILQQSNPPISAVLSAAQPEVRHPNPTYYKVSIHQSVDASGSASLVLSQSYDDGWIAVMPSKTFPFLVPAGKHVLVNNWENGWVLMPQGVNREPVTIYLFFWPQVLEWVGFLLLPLPFIWGVRKPDTL